MATSMLVGYTGFVGSNIDAYHKFTWRINTKNSEEAVGKQPDLLVYSGLRAEKFLANNDPEADLLRIREAMEQIREIAPKRMVLISTIDVYPKPDQVDEDSVIEEEELEPYGKNRYLLEQLVREYQSDALIVRLPGLFGQNLKKNFIYDYIHVIPGMLKAEKYGELMGRSDLIRDTYMDMGNGFFKCRLEPDRAKRMKTLKREFLLMGFSALSFTDSRSVFQFYPLNRLWSDIEKALDKGIPVLNVATEPVGARELYRYLSGAIFVNECSKIPAFYDYRSKYAEEFGGQNGYFMNKNEVMEQINEFVKESLA